MSRLFKKIIDPPATNSKYIRFIKDCCVNVPEHKEYIGKCIAHFRDQAREKGEEKNFKFTVRDPKGRKLVCLKVKGGLGGLTRTKYYVDHGGIYRYDWRSKAWKRIKKIVVVFAKVVAVTGVIAAKIIGPALGIDLSVVGLDDVLTSLFNHHGSHQLDYQGDHTSSWNHDGYQLEYHKNDAPSLWNHSDYQLDYPKNDVPTSLDHSDYQFDYQKEDALTWNYDKNQDSVEYIENDPDYEEEYPDSDFDSKDEENPEYKYDSSLSDISYSERDYDDNEPEGSYNREDLSERNYDDKYEESAQSHNSSHSYESRSDEYQKSEKFEESKDANPQLGLTQTSCRYWSKSCKMIKPQCCSSIICCSYCHGDQCDHKLRFDSLQIYCISCKKLFFYMNSWKCPFCFTQLDQGSVINYNSIALRCRFYEKIRVLIIPDCCSRAICCFECHNLETDHSFSNNYSCVCCICDSKIRPQSNKCWNCKTAFEHKWSYSKISNNCPNLKDFYYLIYLECCSHAFCCASCHDRAEDHKKIYKNKKVCLQCNSSNVSALNEFKCWNCLNLLKAATRY